jgi:hypothetical protein
MGNENKQGGKESQQTSSGGKAKGKDVNVRCIKLLISGNIGELRHRFYGCNKWYIQDNLIRSDK